MSKRWFFCLISLGVLSASMASANQDSNWQRPPNLIVIITDDQGYGDIGAHGHPLLKTPHLDGLWESSTRLERFYVAPVCSPTRASLMTGRYNYRTGVVDTYIGRSMMHASEKTLPELLQDAGYRTGIFGKWHLGDNYPLRAMDQGFEESLIHRGGGIGQPSDPPETSYFDPWLQHNGETVRREGFCTDIFADATLAFIEAHQNEPFFAYLATNAPHSPYIAPEEYKQPYLDFGLDDELAAFFGMITNIDHNVGRILKKLEELGIRENTLLIFLTDNGSAVPSNDEAFAGPFRGKKGQVYEGGIRVPCFIHWPGQVEEGKALDTLSAHIDLLPTALAALQIPIPKNLHWDGQNLWPIIQGKARGQGERNVVLQWHRGDVPEAFRGSAVVGTRWKLVNGVELYDLESDPRETSDVANNHPEILSQLRSYYEQWFSEVGETRGYAPPRIFLAAEEEQGTSVLTPQDWRNSEGWPRSNFGHWEVFIPRTGRYVIELEFGIPLSNGEATVAIGGKRITAPIAQDATTHRLDALSLKGPAEDRLSFHITHDSEDRAVRFVRVSWEGTEAKP